MVRFLLTVRLRRTEVANIHICIMDFRCDLTADSVHCYIRKSLIPIMQNSERLLSEWNQGKQLNLTTSQVSFELRRAETQYFDCVSFRSCCSWGSPSDWEEGITVPMWKKWGPAGYSNYCPIQLLCAWIYFTHQNLPQRHFALLPYFVLSAGRLPKIMNAT